MIEYTEPSWKNTPIPSEVYSLWKGSLFPEVTETDFHDYNEFIIDPDTGNPVFLTPTITTFYGHILTAPYGVKVVDISATRKIKLVDLTLHRADADISKEITVRAWQGDNNTFHITEPLPEEDEVLGPVNRVIFGKADSVQSEKKDWLINKIYYGDTAVLDVDISKIITPGKILTRS